MWYDILDEKYKSPAYLKTIRQEFEEKGLVIFDKLFTDATVNYISKSGDRLKSFLMEREFTMEEFQTKRDMKIIGGGAVIEREEGVVYLYRSADLTDLLENIVGQKIYPCEKASQWCVFNVFEGKGKTQGWHTDDTAFVLIHMIEENLSMEKEGGALCCIFDWDAFVEEKSREGIVELAELYEVAKKEDRIEEIYLKGGQSLLFRGDKIIHQVGELPKQNSLRKTFLISWQHAEHVEYDETGDKLYTYQV